MVNTTQSVDSLPALEYTPCALCGQDNTRQRLTSQDWLHGGPDKFTIVECQTCGLVYLNPRPTAANISRYYPDNYEYAPSRHHEADTNATSLSQQIRRSLQTLYYGYPQLGPNSPWLVPLIGLYHRLYRTLALPIMPWRSGGRILDVGCGTGDYLAGLRQMGWAVQGIEINPHAVQHAREVLHLDVAQSDFLQARLPANHFDVVTMWWYLEHIPNPLQVLQEARRVLKPDGVLWLGVPNWAGWEARFFRTAWYHLDTPRHFYLFTPATLRAMLEHAGWSVRQRRNISWLNDPAESIERWRQMRTGHHRLLPRGLRLLLAPLGWLSARFGMGSLLVVAARPNA